jgi:hypothetical protein
VVEHEGEDQLVLADADTLIVRDLSAFFSDSAADVIFTWKPENVPVNTGVMLVKSGPPATTFFRRLEERTVEILETPELYQQANDPALGYGAADQMALMQLVGFEREKTGYAIEVGGVPVQLRAEPCSRLNETNSRPLSDEIHVIHYKGGWQPILLQGRPFSRFRTRADSWEMFALYLTTFREALAHLNSRARSSYTARDFGVVVPFYFRAATGGFDALLYAAWRVKEAVKRAALLLRGAPLPRQPSMNSLNNFLGRRRLARMRPPRAAGRPRGGEYAANVPRLGWGKSVAAADGAIPELQRLRGLLRSDGGGRRDHHQSRRAHG